MKKILLILLAAAATAANAQGIQRLQQGGQAQPGQPQQALATPNFQSQPPQAGQAQQGRAIRPEPMPTPYANSAGPDLVQEGLNQMAPLTPEEIRRLRAEMLARAKAATEPLAPTAKPSTRLAHVDLSPGATPEVIRIALNEGAGVNFIDAAGRPWEIEDAHNYSPTGFDISRIGANGLSIGSKLDQAIGNILVKLKDLNTLVTFKVVSGHSATREIDYFVDMQLPRYLPGQAAPVGAVERQPGLGVDELMDYLLRTPPKDAKLLSVDGLTGAMAWQAPGGSIMLRTDRMVLSPKWKRRQSSSTGVTVYELPVASQVLVSDDGRMVPVKISGFDLNRQTQPKEARK